MQARSVAAVLLGTFIVLGACVPATIAPDPESSPDERVVALDDEDYYPLRRKLEVLEDPTGSLTFQQALARDDYRVTWGNAPAFGFTDSVYWARFRLRNPDSVDRVIYVESLALNMNQLDFHLLNGEDLLRRTRTGFDFPFHTRELNNRTFVFRVRVPAGQERVVLFRFQATESMNFPIWVYSEDGFFSASLGRYTIYGMYFGIMFVMVIYNLILYFSYRDRNYIYYVLYILSFLTIQLGFLGFLFQYVIPDQTELNKIVPKAGTGLTVFWAVVFARSFLSVRRFSAALDNVLLLVMGIAVVQSVFVLFYYDRAGAIFTNLLSLSMAVLLLWTGIYITWRGYHPARYFLLAFGMLIAGVMLLIFMFLGVLPGTWITRYGLQVGSALEMVLLSLGLRDRIITMRHEREASEKRHVESRLRLLDSFERFVPRQFLEHLGHRSVEDVVPGDAVREEITVLFNDLRGFTALSESLSVEENFQFINEYVRAMQPAIARHGGFIDKFIGDAIMALFSKPDDAVAAALAMREALDELNAGRKARGQSPVEMGIGLNTGELMLGTVGTADWMDTTVMGDTVNLASRLEGLTREYRVKVLVSEFTYKTLGDSDRFNFRELDLVRVKGKQRPVRIYELAGPA